jgi:hypothetical protein
MVAKKWAYYVAGCALLVALTCLYQLLKPRRIERRIELHPLSSHGEISSLSREGEACLEKEWTLWQQRRQRDISQELLPYLQKPDAEVRLFAIRALAKLDSPAAKPAHLASGFSSERQNLLYNLSLARIRTQNLEGPARLEAISKSVGISWPELIEKSKIVNGKFGAYSQNTKEALVIEEIVDTLYVMARRGKKIDGLIDDLTLHSVPQLRLKGAKLSEKAEAELLLDYLMRQKVITSQTMEIRHYLSEMGQPAIEPVIARLKEMQAHPKSYENTHGYSELFRTAYVLGDSRALPILKYFETYSHKWIPHYANQSRSLLEVKLKLHKNLPPPDFYN